LADGEVESLVAGLAGAAPGPRLRGALAQAGGNPRFARDIFDALVRGGQVRVAAGTAELVGPKDEPPAGLGEAIGHRLDYLSLEALPVLRVAAVLGTEFSVYDLATVVGRLAGALLPVLDEATAAGVLGDVGDRLRFRHGVVRQAFYETTPLSARSALHRQVARALVEAGLPGERAAAHLAAVPDTVDDWAVDWLAEQAAALADRAPDLAARLLPAAAQRCPAADHRREPLVCGLARALYRLNRLDEAEAVARHAGAVATDPARAAETAWLLASILLAAGRYVDAMPVLDGSLVRADVPALWRARLLAWRAKVLPYAGRREVAEAAARRALADGEALADRVTIGHALHTLHLLAGHQTGIGYADRALEVIGDLAETTDLRIALLTDRAYNLEALGASERAQASMRAALLLAERFGPARFPEVRVRMADWCIEQGRWDDAWAELEPLTGDVGLVERLTRLGGLAFVAAHRDDRAAAGQLLAAAAKLPRITGYLQGRATLLYLARAVDAEQRRGPDGALATLAGTVAPDRGRELRERHRWLPDLVRLALAAGDRSLARDAVAAAEADAVAEPLPRRLVSARRARAVLAGDAGALLEQAGDRRVAAAPLTLGQTCEEAAALLAQAGDVAGARAALTDAVRAYLDLGAGWDVRRADARLRRYGVRRGPRTVRRRPTAGWEALTPTEVRVSALVAQGRSNPEIAAAMLLSRRTVQAHVSNILAKLGYASRLEIAREVVRRMPPP
ncbi:MAG TPA: LuxR C-terminal-related transcriptional regulator, partial [Pilimelia sp.]|nr:LuxR C-terminal-related transcriptional regulator [Pilimelia sp.]